MWINALSLVHKTSKLKCDCADVIRWVTYSKLSGPTSGTNLCKYLDDVIKWKHFPRYRPFVRGIHRWPKGQWRGALMFSLICAWTNSWANNGDAGDLRRYRAHYDVIVMITHDVNVCRMFYCSQIYEIWGIGGTDKIQMFMLNYARDIQPSAAMILVINLSWIVSIQFIFM